MSILNLYDLSTLLSSGLWVLVDAVLLVAGILFFKVERRFHTVAIIVGAVISMFVDGSYLLETLFPESLYAEDETVNDVIWSIRMGIHVIGSALMAYGIVTAALLQFRRHRAQTFGGNPPGAQP